METENRGLDLEKELTCSVSLAPCFTPPHAMSQPQHILEENFVLKLRLLHDIRYANTISCP